MLHREERIGDVDVQQPESQGRVSIRPTVLIGLGGTGKEVLRRLRRMFYEKYRRPGLPVMEYLWFDTDIRNIDITRKKIDRLDGQIDFSAQEKIDGSVSPAELESYRSNRGVHPHIWSWFPDALDTISSTTITQGAGQMRPCGRLAFFHHYDRLREAIRRKGERVTSADAKAQMRRVEQFSDYNADPSDLEIVLVTSIAGGTGSGAFIDMGFLCRDLFENAVSTAYLVLPSVFDSVIEGNRQTVCANGFAAVKELEHYMQPHFDAEGEDGGHFTKHIFEWDGRKNEVEAPPFSTVYLLDNRNFADVHVEDFTDVFQMIAEFLLLDFEQTNFAMDKRSRRSNMEQHLQQVAKYESDSYIQYFPCRYASFGLSQMEINQPRLANAAANWFAQYLVEFIIAAKNEVPPGFSTADVFPHLEQINLTTDRLLNLALNRPGRDDTLADIAVQDTLQPVFDDLQENIRKAPEYKDVTVLEKQVAEAQSKIESITLEVRQKVAERLKEEGTVKGDDLRQIIDNADRLLPELERKVEEHCVGLLCEPLEHGPNYVISYLEYGKEALEEVRHELTDLANEPMEGPKVSPINIALSEDYRHFDQRLKEARDLTLAWLTKKKAMSYYERKKEEAFRENVQLINRDLRDKVETIRGELTDWVRKRFRKEAARFLADLLEKITGQLGSRAEITGDDGKISIKVTGLQEQVQIFRETLQKMAGDFSQIHNAYVRRETGIRNLNLTPELNYAEEIVDHLRNVRKWTERDLPRLCRGGLEKYFRSEQAKSLFTHLATAEGAHIDTIKTGTREIFKRSANRNRSLRDWADVHKTIDEYTFDLFKDFKTDIHATEELRQRLGNRETEEIVERNQKAAPRISSPRSWYSPDQQRHTDNCIGVGNADWVNEVNRIAAPSLGNRYQDSRHRDDAIVFVNQWMAFPIFYIGNIDDLERHYRANIETNPDNVYRRHIIKNYIEFSEILPPRNDSEVRALVNAQRVLIDGLIMGIITYDDSQKKFYRPFVRRGIEDKDNYGHNLDRARLTIADSSERRDRLDVEIRRMEERWHREQCDDLFIQRLFLKSRLLNRVFPETHIYVLGKAKSADSTFRVLLEESYQSEYQQVLEQFALQENILNKRFEELEDQLKNFASPLPYRDRFCKDAIYVFDHDKKAVCSSQWPVASGQ